MPGRILTKTVGRVPMALPLMRLVAIAEFALLARRHMIKLEPHERRRVAELVVRTRGRRRNLTARERRELLMLVAKAEPALFARSAVRKLSPLRR
jgi:hypothetical protein